MAGQQKQKYQKTQRLLVNDMLAFLMSCNAWIALQHSFTLHGLLNCLWPPWRAQHTSNLQLLNRPASVSASVCLCFVPRAVGDLIHTKMLHRPFTAALAKAGPPSQQRCLSRIPQQPHHPQRHSAGVQHRCRAAAGPSNADDAAPAPQQQLSAADKDSVLEQLELLRMSASAWLPLLDNAWNTSASPDKQTTTCANAACRQLDGAVAQEDYSRAQQLKERVDVRGCCTHLCSSRRVARNTCCAVCSHPHNQEHLLAPPDLVAVCLLPPACRI